MEDWIVSSESESNIDDFPCPNCGAKVSAGATFCRECGASDDAGWGTEDEDLDAAYGEDEDFDYDEFIGREFPQYAPDGTRVTGKQMLIRLIAIILCLCLLWFGLGF